MIVDTNVLVAYLAGDEKVVTFLDSWRLRGGYLYLPSIVEAELLSFDGWTGSEDKTVKQFLTENFISVSFDRNLGRLATELRRNVKIKLPDAGIAATALNIGAPLLTRNLRDFEKIPKLKVISI